MPPQELRMLGRRGRVTPVEVSATPVRFQGEPAARVLMRDLSEWKRAQAELKTSQGILRAFYDGAPMLMGVVEVTPDGEIIAVSVNEAAARSFGSKPSEAAGITARVASMPREEQEVWLSHYREAEAAGHPIHFVLGGQMRDRTRSLSVTVAPIEKSETGYPRFCFISEDITELVRDQERLRLSESRLEEAQRLAHLGSWTWNLATKELTWSDELCRIYGVEPDHHKPSYDDFLARVHPEDRAEVEKLVAQAMLDSKPFSHESRIIWPDGEVRTILDQAEVLVDGQGRPTGMAGACLDITDQKRAERTQETLLLISEAAHSAGTLPDLFRRIHEIIAGLLPAKNFFVALYDERKDELSFPYFVDELDPPPGVMKLNGGSLSGQVIRTGKALLLTRETRSGVSSPLLPVVGSESMDWVGVPLKSRSRTIGALVLQSYSGDVRYTSKDQALLEFVSGQVAVAIERKQAEQELKDQNELFQMLQRATNDVICDWDLLTDQAKWNDRVTAVFGYPFEEVVAPGTHWWRDRVHPEDLERVLKSTQEAIEQGESVWSAEYRFQRKDGTYARVLDRGYLARDAAGKATRLISAMSDLTLRIRAEEAQAANQAKSEFLATMTHELRTPMIGMLGMMEILSHTKLDPDQRSALVTIHSSAQALLGIIGDILDFSKIEAGKLRLEPQVVSLRRIAEEAFTGTSAAAADKGLQATCEIDPGIAKAHLADPLRFREIIDNFLSNALKFTRHGSIGIRAELLQADKESQTLAFRVWDTGIGVSKENQKRLFQPFVQAESTTTRRFGGTGLGLSICLRLAEMMGGSITMESEEGKGTTMSFIAAFPLADPEALEGATQWAATQPMEPPDREAALEAGYLVLLVEDHPTNRLVLTQQLRLSGYQVDTAEDGLAALEALGQTRYGLLLTDIQMPHLDGYQLAKEVRSIEAQTGKPRIPILALTANTMQGELDRCLAVGMDDCIIKPVSIPDLDAKLHCWLPGAAKLMKPRAPDAQPERSPDSARPPKSTGSPMDLAMLDGLSGGDPGASLDILRDFRDTLENDMAGLGNLAHQGDLPTLARLAHRIKGASAMVGAKPLAEAARSVEAQAQAGDSHLVAEALAAMETAYADLERYLAQEIEKG
ncbi:MAG: PAS domain-containing protein [Acidobacteriota bacterium]|nr:PAS domain-containing protein [Acidobacteriota bacterium]